MQSTVYRIAIIGPESTGKSALCEQLALHYKTIWIPEYARVYLPLLKRAYTIEDIINIYQTQFEKETDSISGANNFIFTDTEFIIAKVWCENSFGYCPESIAENIKNNPYDFYLLTSPDLPWVYDTLRENPGKGDFFFDWYKKILVEEKLPFGIVDGIGGERLKNAISLIEKFSVAETIW